MEKKTTSKKSDAVQRAPVRAELLKGSPRDENEVSPDRVLANIESLAAASEVEAPEGELSRARIVWYALAAYLDDAGILGQLNAAATLMSTGGRNPSPEQAA